MPEPIKPHPLNVIGDYYVEDGCCTSCDVPRIEAPDLFDMTSKPDCHCYVKKQPNTPEETERMLATIRHAEFDCIRYRGMDPAIFTRISAANGHHDACDHEPPPEAELGFRTHVTFRFPDSEITQPSVLAIQFRKFLKARFERLRKGMVGEMGGTVAHLYRLKWRWWPPPDSVVFRFGSSSWETIRFEVLASDSHTIHVFFDDTTIFPFPNLIAEWIKTLPGIQDIRWYTQKGWTTTGTWHASYY
ncbi:MAG: ferredoxin [Planctomycetaceae bacterium]|nr:ferredoxin [Planctomycetaceae bacterium]